MPRARQACSAHPALCRYLDDRRVDRRNPSGRNRVVVDGPRRTVARSPMDRAWHSRRGVGRRPGRLCEPRARWLLAALGSWVADDAADAQWGRPVDVVDLNNPRTDDRAVLPDGAKPGDRFVAAWDAGGRTYVHVVERTSPADPIAEKQGASTRPCWISARRALVPRRCRGRLGLGDGDGHWTDPAPGRDRTGTHRPVCSGP
jgi:hypothetical protein